MLKTDLWSDDSSTLHTITGSSSEVETAVEKLMKLYPPEGYSTFLKEKKNLPDGSVKVVVFRFNSCD